MDDDFDMESAVNELGVELGFDVAEPAEKEAPPLPPAEVPAAPSNEGTESPATPASSSAPEAPATVPAPAPISAPNTWRAEAAAEFSKLPPIVQQEVLKREEDIFKGIEGYKAEAAFGRGLKTVLDPYLPTLAQYGISPETQVKSMMEANYVLAFGAPQEKAALVRQIINDYKISPEDLGFIGNDSLQALPPEVIDLQRQVQTLNSQLTATQRQREEEKKSEITRHVQTFASDPKNVYFEELSNDIAHLLRTGAEKTIEAAYEKAMWMNPVVRAKELSRQQAEQAEAARKAAEAKAAEAKKAVAANVRPKAKSGSATAPLGSMDDTLSQALAAIRDRG